MPDVDSVGWPRPEDEEEVVYPEGDEGYGPYRGLVKKYSGEYGIPENIARAMMETESTYRPDAYNSGSKARGLYQITPIAAEDVGEDYEEMFEPETNIRSAMKYLRKMFDRFGGDEDPEVAVSAFNWGPTSTANKRWEDRPTETKEYWDKIRLNMFKYEEPDRDLPGMWMGGQVGRSRYR